MMPHLKRHAWLLFAAVAFFTLLGQRGLNEPDEGRYAEIGREMTVTGEWLVPHLNGNPHFQKPPVVYWLTALSLGTFGNHEWAARLPSALGALGIVALCYLLSLRLFKDHDRAAIAALVLTSIGGFFAMSRLLTPDMTMTFWIMAAITAALHRRHWLFFIFMGIGFLTKGPMALIVPLCAVIGWQWRATAEERLRIPWVRGLLLMFAVSLSWFVTLSLRDAQLFDYFWRYELVERFGSRTHGRSKPFWFFFLVLPAALLPWVFFLPLKRAWLRFKSAPLHAWQTLLIGWIIPPLTLLSISGSKLPTYVLPLMPAFALGIAAAVPTLRRAWMIAVPTVVCLLAADAFIANNNDMLQAQASSEQLVQLLRAQEPDMDKAILFACETRTQGFAFYAERLIHITRGDADIVLKPTAEQNLRLYSSVKDCIKQLTDGPAAHGIVKTDRFLKSFDPKKWRLIATSGEFSLVANHSAHSM